MAERKSCRGCVYHRRIGNVGSYKVCHYLIDTGEPRGCPPDKCEKYTKPKECRGCKDRTVDCHATCNDYKVRQEINNKKKEFLRMMNARNDTFEKAAKLIAWYRNKEMEK